MSDAFIYLCAVLLAFSVIGLIDYTLSGIAWLCRYLERRSDRKAAKARLAHIRYRTTR